MTNKIKKGFAAMDPDEHREIARKGGQSAHAQGVAHRWTKEAARAAAQKSVASRGAHRWTSEEAALAAQKSLEMRAHKKSKTDL